MTSIFLIVGILTLLGVLTLVGVILTYYWGERGKPPLSREERRRLLDEANGRKNADYK